ncbi:MAG: sugar kinase, partial [Pseudomonadota bacterium]|nr:sugar kinase [Pseudomonadota bacterium]
GTHSSMDYLLTEQVIEEMRQSVVQVDAPLPEVVQHSWGQLRWAKGAAAYAVEKVSAQCVRRLVLDAV